MGSDRKESSSSKRRPLQPRPPPPMNIGVILFNVGKLQRVVDFLFRVAAETQADASVTKPPISPGWDAHLQDWARWKADFDKELEEMKAFVRTRGFTPEFFIDQVQCALRECDNRLSNLKKEAFYPVTEASIRRRDKYRSLHGMAIVDTVKRTLKDMSTWSDGLVPVQ